MLKCLWYFVWDENWEEFGFGWEVGVAEVQDDCLVCRQARLRVRRRGEASGEGGKSVLPAELSATIQTPSGTHGLYKKQLLQL